MSAKKLSKKTVQSSEYTRYLETAEELYSGAERAAAESNHTAAGVLIVHAAIAYTDALTIKFGGVKSSGEDHGQASDLLRQILYLSSTDGKAIKRFDKLIAEKTKVSYTGLTPTSVKISSMMKDLTRYREWAREKLS